MDTRPILPVTVIVTAAPECNTALHNIIDALRGVEVDANDTGAIVALEAVLNATSVPASMVLKAIVNDDEIIVC